MIPLKRYMAALWFVASGAQAQTSLVIDFSRSAQTIENIGSSTGMHGDHIARHWNPEVVNAVADLLFSQKFDQAGSPRGIGLSAFRIQIGAGSEGEESGIQTPWRRTDCFLRPDGSYDWKNRGRGVQYWRNQCAAYSVPTVIGYLNSPPVYFTESGYAFKTNQVFTSTLKQKHYADYAGFLARVAGHFQSLGMPFTHISPVNEPQWFWHGRPGEARQEGSPWTNKQIARLVRLADSKFRARRIQTRLLIPEAAEYAALTRPQPNRPHSEASDQINAFWNRKSDDYLGALQSLEAVVAGHAYFSDSNIGKMIKTRRDLSQAVAGSDSKLRFWQTEYCLLGDGWTGGLPVESVDEMTAALLLARNIHADFTLADATAWQWWSSTEPEFGHVPRYYLIECGSDEQQSIRPTKLLWALGHYSRFVRPGMERIKVESSLSLEAALQSVMASAFYDREQKRWVLVLINFSDSKQEVEYQTRMLPDSGRSWKATGFQSDARMNLQRVNINGQKFFLPPKSIVTIVNSAGG